MGGKYSIVARNHDDESYVVMNYKLTFLHWIVLGIKCFIKYDVVSMEKHGGPNG
jgi:hypothetical protein